MSKKAFFLSTLKAFLNSFSIITNGIDEFLNGGDILNFDHDEPFSISFWYKPGTTGVARALVNKILGSPNFTGYQLQQETDNTLVFFLINNLSNFVAIQGTTALSSTSTWYHVTLTYSGNDAASSFEMYINAVAETLVVINDNLTLSTVNNRDLNIMRRSDDARYTSGKVDELAFYNKELSAAEVTTIYNLGVPRDLSKLLSFANLVTWWRFTQKDIDNFPTIADHSGSGFDLIAVNMNSGDIQGDVPA